MTTTPKALEAMKAGELLMTLRGGGSTPKPLSPDDELWAAMTKASEMSTLTGLPVSLDSARAVLREQARTSKETPGAS